MIDEEGAQGAGTGTLAGAREHARSQDGPAATAATGLDVALPDQVGGEVVWAQTVGGGDYASFRLQRGATLRITDELGDACVQLLVHNASQPAERLNVADTVKVQWQAYLTTGAQLLSDMGRVLMTIVDDTSERHDCLCGCSSRATNLVRYGDGGASGPSPNGRDLLALGVAKVGLSRLDVGPNVNLFKSVRVDDTGALHLDGALRAGAHVDLRAEMDVLVTLANTPHPLDERAAYIATPVRCVAWLAGDAVLAPEPSTPERLRAAQNTDAFLAGLQR